MSKTTKTAAIQLEQMVYIILQPISTNGHNTRWKRMQDSYCGAYNIIICMFTCALCGFISFTVTLLLLLCDSTDHTTIQTTAQVGITFLQFTHQLQNIIDLKYSPLDQAQAQIVKETGRPHKSRHKKTTVIEAPFLNVIAFFLLFFDQINASKNLTLFIDKFTYLGYLQYCCPRCGLIIHKLQVPAHSLALSPPPDQPLTSWSSSSSWVGKSFPVAVALLSF